LEQAMSVMLRDEQRLTPDDVQAVSFRSAHLGRRGLDEDHVRAFCHQVEDELMRLVNERTALQEEVSRLRRHILGQSGEDGGFGYSRADANLQAVSILHRAQQTADHYVAEAQEYSRHLAQDTQQRRADILAQAREHAARVMEVAHREADQAAQAAVAALLAIASPAAEAEEADLAAAAEEADLAEEAQRVMAAPTAEAEPVTETMPATGAGPATGTEPAEGRPDLPAELAYLQTFRDVYRAHLRAYLCLDAVSSDVSEFEQPPSP
jgi:DivIVA domain-containing protein